MDGSLEKNLNRLNCNFNDNVNVKVASSAALNTIEFIKNTRVRLCKIRDLCTTILDDTDVNIDTIEHLQECLFELESIDRIHRLSERMTTDIYDANTNLTFAIKLGIVEMLTRKAYGIGDK